MHVLREDEKRLQKEVSFKSLRYKTRRGTHARRRVMKHKRATPQITYSDFGLEII